MEDLIWEYFSEHQQIALEKSYTVVRMTSSDDGFHDNVITFRYSKLIQGSPQAEECHLQWRHQRVHDVKYNCTGSFENFF